MDIQKPSAWMVAEADLEGCEGLPQHFHYKQIKDEDEKGKKRYRW